MASTNTNNSNIGSNVSTDFSDFNITAGNSLFNCLFAERNASFPVLLAPAIPVVRLKKHIQHGDKNPLKIRVTLPPVEQVLCNIAIFLQRGR